MDRDRSAQGSGRRPSDTEELVGGTAASERLTDREHAVQPGEAGAREAASAGGTSGEPVRGSAKTGGLSESRHASEDPSE
jgi:hypothetical protein